MNLKRWIPNVVTLLLAVLLVITQQVWAGPLVTRLTSTTASSKTTINYQGYLTDAGGTPVNDTLDMVFRLYGMEAGGEALWSESHNGVPVANGLFSVLLGGSASDPNPIPLSLFAENDSLWLGISVGGDQEMTPREQLASAPSAMTVPDGSVTTVQLADRAVTSAKLDNNLALKGNLTVAGNVSVGTTDTSTGKLVVAGVIHGGGASGDAFRIGDDAKLVDINSANTIGVYGLQDSTVATLKLGSGGGTISGYNGTIGVGGNLDMTGIVQSSNNIPTAAIQDGAVISAKIQDGQVGNADLADNAVNSAKIQNGQVSSADLADNAVTSAKIQNGQVSSADIANNAVNSAKIEDGQVTTGDLADGAVNQAKAPSLIQSAIGNGRRIWAGTVTAVADSNGWIKQSFSHSLSRVDGGAITPHWNSAVWYTAKPPTFGTNYRGIVVGGGLTPGATYTFSVVLVGD